MHCVFFKNTVNVHSFVHILFVHIIITGPKNTIQYNYDNFREKCGIIRKKRSYYFVASIFLPFIYAVVHLHFIAFYRYSNGLYRENLHPGNDEVQKITVEPGDLEIQYTTQEPMDLENQSQNVNDATGTYRADIVYLKRYCEEN